jgi:hypothetical protein
MTNKNNNIQQKIIKYLKEDFDFWVDVKELETKDVVELVETINKKPKNFQDFIKKNNIAVCNCTEMSLKELWDLFDTTLIDLDTINKKQVKNVFKSWLINYKKDFNDFEIEIMQEFIKNN